MSESMYWLVLLLLLGTLTLGLQSAVFLGRSDASQLMRTRRANSFLEEMKPGNLERECFEELCSQEEAAEIYQSKEKTMEFWYRYQSFNRCQRNPCLNGGMCSVKRDSYECLCAPRYTGPHCETEVFECEYKNGGCLHYCSNPEPTQSRVTCSCADGYELQADGKSCKETAPYPCGKQWSQGSLQRSLLEDLEELNLTRTLDHRNHLLLNRTHPPDNSTRLNASHPNAGGSEDDTRIVGGQLQRQGGSPWQALLYRKDDNSFCGGTLIAPRWVVTAAHCLQEKPDYVTIGDYDKLRADEGEQKIKVERTVIHPYYHEYTFDSDIALIRLSQPVEFSQVASPACLPDAHLATQLVRNGERGLVTGWGATSYLGSSSRFLRKVMLPVVTQEDCIQSTEQVITDNMFCAGYLHAEKDACTGDSGGPFVVNYRGTWFLTGVVSWGEKCAAEGKYGVYTRLGNFLQWIRDEMEKKETVSKTSSSTSGIKTPASPSLKTPAPPLLKHKSLHQ
ncbi:coagulation factor X [Brachyhypopomus gauderio]|uniref:coagulation factor X n=1 Tax=Brachyhypopomus gauderio TaxID=698409 RepID=UPI0040426F2B